MNFSKKIKLMKNKNKFLKIKQEIKNIFIFNLC